MYDFTVTKSDGEVAAFGITDEALRYFSTNEFEHLSHAEQIYAIHRTGRIAEAVEAMLDGERKPTDGRFVLELIDVM